MSSIHTILSVVSGPCNLNQSVPFPCMLFDDQNVHCVTWQSVETVFQKAYGPPSNLGSPPLALTSYGKFDPILRSQTKHISTLWGNTLHPTCRCLSQKIALAKQLHPTFFFSPSLSSRMKLCLQGEDPREEPRAYPAYSKFEDREKLSGHAMEEG